MQSKIFSILGVIFFPVLILYGMAKALIFISNTLVEFIEIFNSLLELFNQFLDYINNKWGKK